MKRPLSINLIGIWGLTLVFYFVKINLDPSMGSKALSVLVPAGTQLAPHPGLFCGLPDIACGVSRWQAGHARNLIFTGKLN